MLKVSNRLRVVAAVAFLTAIPIAVAASTTPTSSTFHDEDTGATCGVAGQSGSPDPALNRLKNRIQPTPDTTPKTVADLRNLPDHAKQARADWSSDDLATFGKIEATPIRVTGYLVGVHPEKAESTNCGATDKAGVDFHTWFVDTADQEKSFSAVMEIAPRWRQVNPAWTSAALLALVKEGAQVRISGWPMYDQEHPEQVGKTRSTLWEIHPITKIEVATNGGWIELGENDATQAVQNTAALHPAGRLRLTKTRPADANARIITQQHALIEQEQSLGE
jgi:hypothetical protein